MWVEVLTAVCLVLVLEGILPFINPAGYKRAVKAMLELPEAPVSYTHLTLPTKA